MLPTFVKRGAGLQISGILLLLVTEQAGTDMLMCAGMKLAHEFKGGILLRATPFVPPVAPKLEIEDRLPILP